MSSAETVFAVLIALFAALGQLLNSCAVKKSAARRRQDFLYYTNLSNIAMLVYHALLLTPGETGERLRTAPWHFAATACILVTFLIFFFVLTRFGKFSESSGIKMVGIGAVTNTIVHYVVPLLTLAEWLLAAEKDGLGLRDVVCWLGVPLAYFLFLCARWLCGGGEIEFSHSRWPYPFIDLDKLGFRSWIRNVVLTIVGFFLLGLALLGISYLIV